MKDWEADDYYDSDEDTFLDRTGTVEKKRQQRMKAAGKRDPGEAVETYGSLVSTNQYCDKMTSVCKQCCVKY